MIKAKKGISHVEMILSFVIFVGFLIFLIAIFKPFSIEQKGVYTENIERSILDYASVNITFLAIKVSNVPIDKTCFEFEYKFSSPPYPQKNIIVKNSSEIYFKTEKQGNNINIQGGNNFYYILSSETFTENSFIPGACHDAIVALGLSREYKMLSYQKIEDIKNRYSNDYNALAQELGIPASKSFSFSIRDNQNNFILRTEEPKGKFTVTARDIPVQIIHENSNYGSVAGNITYAKLNIKVW